MLWVCAWKNRRSFALFPWILGEWVHCRINEFRISFIIERVIVGHRCKPWSCTFKASKRTYGINSYVRLFVLMLIPTILSINWFFSFIPPQAFGWNPKKLASFYFSDTMVQRIFLYFWAKNEKDWLLNDYNLLLLNRTIRKTGCETSRSEMEYWKILHSAKDLKQKGRNEQRSADVTGSGRLFCDGLLNSKKASSNEAFFFYTIKQDTSPNSTI